MLNIDTQKGELVLDCTLRSRVEWDKFIGPLNALVHALWDEEEEEPEPRRRKTKTKRAKVGEPKEGTRAAQMLSMLRNGSSESEIGKVLKYKTLTPIKMWSGRWRNAGLLS